MKRIEYFLNGPDPVQAFKSLREYPTKNPEDRKRLFKDLIKTWEFFAQEKRSGRLHYRPEHPEDIQSQGWTNHIEVNSHNPTAYSIQFNGRVLENTFVVSFQENELTKQEAQKLLGRSLKFNSKEFVSELSSNQKTK